MLRAGKGAFALYQPLVFCSHAIGISFMPDGRPLNPADRHLYLRYTGPLGRMKYFPGLLQSYRPDGPGQTLQKY